MIKDFDINNMGKNILYLEYDIYGEYSIWNYDINSNERKMIIDEKIRAQGPRCSDSNKITFNSKAKIYTYNLKTKEMQNIYSKEGYLASFCEMSNRNDLLTFSAYGDGKPPLIYIADIDKNNINAISPLESVNRFPHWSYSDSYIVYTHQKESDIKKLKWVYVYSIKTGMNYLIPKDKNTQCIINVKCWSPDKEEVVYLERDNDNTHVKIFNAKNKEVRCVTEVNQVQEVSFLDGNHLILINEDILKIYSLRSNRVVHKIHIPLEQKILFRSDGAIIRVANNDVYFLTKSGDIYSWNIENKTKNILKSKEEEKPQFKIQEEIIKSSENKDIPVYRYIPITPNGLVCILAIGGPGGEANSEDRINMEFLRRGYELIVPAYRGCVENPDNFGELSYGDVQDIIDVGKYYKEKYRYRIPIIGYSYGGLLLFLALARAKDIFSCGVSLWGVTEIRKLSLHLERIIYEDMSIKEQESLLDGSSAVLLSDKIDVPCYIFHGTKDTTSTNHEVEQIKKNIINNGVECNLTIYENEPHGLHGQTKDYFIKMYSFLMKNRVDVKS